MKQLLMQIMEFCNDWDDAIMTLSIALISIALVAVVIRILLLPAAAFIR